MISTKGLKVKVDKPTLESHFNSSLGSPWQPIGTHDASSDSESDRAESSSPDASMADTTPMLDELHPLLDSEPLQPALKSVDNSDASSQENESDDGSGEEEAEQQEDEEEEVLEEKDDSNQEVVKWTADDQKNLMDLGTSEMERNQRLENLIAKRRARKNLRFEAERNLIDLDSIDPALNVQIPNISAPRRNPFDVPYDSPEIIGLPPIPGSAPSVLLPRRNPFDLPYSQEDQSGTLTGENLSHQEFVSVPQRDTFYRRHESFTLGASFSGELKQEKHESRFSPYFVPERAVEAGFDTLHRQLNENTDSKVSSVPESDAASAAIDLEHPKEVEEELHQSSELSPAKHDIEHVVQERQSSAEVYPVDVDCVRSGFGAAHDCTIGMDNFIIPEETRQSLQAVEDKIKEVDFDLPISDSAKLEVIEDKHGESSSSSSAENDSKTSTLKALVNVEPIRGDFSASSIDSIHSLPEDSDPLDRAEEMADDSQVEDPIYDSSPSANEKSLSNMSTLDEALFDAGKEVNSGSCFTSDIHAKILEVDSPPRSIENTMSSVGDSLSVTETMGEDLAYSSGGLWVASPSLSAVDVNESRSREIHVIMERDVLQVGLSGDDENFTRPIALLMPRSLSRRTIRPSSLSSVVTESSEDSPFDVDASGQHEEDEKMESTTSDSFVLSDHVASVSSEKADPSTETLSHFEDGLDESPVSILNTPIPQVKLEDIKTEEAHESMVDTAGIVGITGLQMIKEPDVRVSDAEKEMSPFQGNPTEETDVVRATKGIDDSLLSELDAVGDFHAEVRLPLETNSNVSDEPHLVLNQPNPDGSSLVLSGIDPETTVYNSKLHVLEACSVEELNSAFKQLHEEAIMHSGSELIVEKSITAKAEAGSIESVITDKHPILSEANSELYAPEAKCTEDLDRPVIPEAESSEILGDSVHLEQTGTQSDLKVVEAKSLEDIHLALKQLSRFTAENPSELMEPKDGSSEIDGHPILSEANSELQVPGAKSIEDLDRPVILEAESSEVLGDSMHLEQTGTQSDLEVVEAKSLEDIHLALKQLSHSTAENPSKAMEPNDGSSEIDRHPILLEENSELQVLEAKSINELDRPVIPESESSEILGDSEHLEQTGAQSDPEVVEAKSVEDIHLALKQHSHGTAENPSKLVEPKDGSLEIDTTDRHLEAEVLQVQSADETRLAFDESIEGETGSSYARGHHKSHKDVTVEEKDKTGKSDSSPSDD